MYKHRLLSKSAIASLALAANSAPVALTHSPSHGVLGEKRSVLFRHQQDYDDWIKDNKYDDCVGMLYTWQSTPPMDRPQHSSLSPNVIMCLGVVDDYTDLKWDVSSGMPHMLHMAQCTDSQLHQPRIFNSDLAYYRPLSSAEVAIVKEKHVRLQAHIDQLRPKYNLVERT